MSRDCPLDRARRLTWSTLALTVVGLVLVGLGACIPYPVPQPTPPIVQPQSHPTPPTPNCIARAQRGVGAHHHNGRVDTVWVRTWDCPEEKWTPESDPRVQRGGN